MISFLRELRLMPIAVVACACLLALKTADLLLKDGPVGVGDDAPMADGDTSVIHTTADEPQPSASVLSWATQMFNFPGGGGAAPGAVLDALPADKGNPDITGSVTENSADQYGKADKNNNTQAKTDPSKPPASDAKPPVGTVIPVDGQPSGAERALLERLQERRQELDTRARELDIRESLIKAAEKRMEGQLTELKEVEGRIAVETQQKDDAQAARFKGLVTMYENMKPRDAAKIFDRLESGVLLDVASKINPRQMSEILAQMSPDSAERLTVELATQAQQVKPGGSPNELPKIQGQSTAP